MIKLQIKKKTLRTWEHIDYQLGMFILSKFYFSADGTKFQVVEQGQAKRRIYDVTEIEVYDIGGSAETFATITTLSIRLEDLKYPAYNLGGVFEFDPSDYDLSEFNNDEVDRYAKLSDIVDTSVTLLKTNILAADLSTQDIHGFVSYINALGSSFFVGKDEIMRFEVDTGQIFELQLNDRSFGGSEPDIISNNVLMIRPFDVKNIFLGDKFECQANGNALSLFGLTTPTTVGTGANLAASFSGSYSTAPRNFSHLRRSMSAASVGGIAEFYEPTLRHCSVGTGFYFPLKVYFDTSTNSASVVCLIGSNTALANANPSALTDVLAIAFDPADANVFVMHNDGAGSATKHNLGTNFAISRGFGVDLAVEIWNIKGSNTVYFRVKNLKNDKYAYYEATTDLPASTVGMTYKIATLNRTDSTSLGAYFSNFKILKQS